MLLVHRLLCVAFLAAGTVFALRFRTGQADSLGSVLLSHPVLAFFGAGGLLLLLALVPQRAFEPFRGRSPLLWLVPALALLAGTLWVGDEINDAYLSLALFVLGPVLATTLWSRAADERGPLAASLLFLSLGTGLFGLELTGSDLGQPVSVTWGSEETFTSLFPRKPPYIGPGGRLRPGLDAYMHSKDLPQGARLQTNAAGFRNAHDIALEPEPGTLRVLNLGDSFSIGMQIGQEEFLGPLLERELSELRSGPVEVVNAEISDPAYGLYYFQEYGHAYGADIVLLGLCANDLMQVDDSFGEGRLFQLDASGRLVPDPDPAPGEGHVHRYAELAYPVPSDRASAYARSPLDFGSASRRLLGKLLRFRAFRLLVPNDSRRSSTPRLMLSMAGEYEQADARMRYFDGSANAGFFAKEARPVMEELFRKFFRVVGALDEQVRASGGRLVLVLFPQRYQVQPEDWALMREAWNLADEDFDLRWYNRRMRELCAERGLLLCDLLDEFQVERGRGSLYISGGDMHINNAGHALAARVVAASLKEVLDQHASDH